MKRKLYILALLGAVSLGTLALDGCHEGREEFTMRAEITEVMEGELLVEVISAPHGNSGPFFVIAPAETPVLDKDGEKSSVTSLEVGNIIDITYGGQVMMSYPPKIAAIRIERV